MAKRDYYEVLGVSRSATQDEIKTAYRELARKYHPDINKDESAQAKFVEIQEAYDVLSDDQKKQMYDRFGHAGEQVSGAGGGRHGGQQVHVDFDMDDLGSMFDTFFGGRGGASPFGGAARQAQRTRRQQPKTPDMRHTIEIDFMTAVQGGKQKMEIMRGSEKSSVEVTIPAGIVHGKKLRIRGVGHPDPNRPGTKSDLILTVHVAKHPLFRRGDPARAEKPSDIYLELPITFAEAALGAKVDIPTPAGTATVTVPKGSKGGSHLRLKGQGAKSSPPGDLYVELSITPPPASAIDADAEQALKAMSQKTPVRQGPFWPGSSSP